MVIIAKGLGVLMGCSPAFREFMTYFKYAVIYLEIWIGYYWDILQLLGNV